MRSLIVTLLLINLWSCAVQIDEAATPAIENDGSMSSLVVPDGFTFKSSQMTKVRVKPFAPEKNYPMGASYKLYAISDSDFSSDSSSDSSLLSSGYLKPGKVLERNFELGNHTTELYLQLQVDGKAYHLFSPKSEFVDFDILREESVLEGGRAANGKGNSNCLPTLVGVDWELWADENKVIIVSTADKAISNIVFNILDKDHFKIEYPVDYGGTVKETSWELPTSAFDFTISQIEGIWVKSGCNKSGDGPGYGEYIINPYYNHKDQDGDSVPDVIDENPEKPTLLSSVHYPGEGIYWTYAFEDNWPYMADYDFNDLVIYYNYQLYVNANDQIESFNYSLQVEAIGAAFDNDFSLSFSGDISSVQVSNTQHHGLSTDLLENGEKVELRFRQIRSLYSQSGFINTDTTKQYVTPKVLTGTVTLTSPISINQFTMESFITINQMAGREVHMSDYPGSVRVDESFYGSAQDDSRPEEGKYYKTRNNHPWAINIPAKWEYPMEHKEVTVAYKRFGKYATSEPLIDWYSPKEENQKSQKVYKKGRGNSKGN
jgi:LruC domain-containing protein